MKHLIIANAAAGNNKDVEAFKKKVEEAFAGLNYEIYYTTGPRSVIPYLKDYFAKNTEETVRVYACGGDGTVHEVVNGLVGAKNAELAILAVGTGNDFVKIYGGKDKFQDFKALIAVEAKPVDLSKVKCGRVEEDWYSINVVNIGFDAMVGAKGNENKLKGKKDPYGFFPAIVPAILHGRFNKIIIKADGEQLNKKKLLLGSIAQGQWIGGEYHASPKSDNTDGLLDVMIMKTMGLFPLLLKFFSKYHDGKHLDKEYKKIIYRRVKTVEVIAEKDIDICLDGEMVRDSKFVVEVVPQAIKLVIPE